MLLLMDLDEVFADFGGGALQVHGWTREQFVNKHPLGVWDMCQTLGVTEDEFWEPIHNAGAQFWEELDPLPWFQGLLDWVNRLGMEWYLVSSPSRDPSSYVGKLNWIAQYFGATFNKFILTQHKHLLARRDTLLVDDKEDNIEKFRKYGGLSVLFPSVGNFLHKYKDDPVSYLAALEQDLAK